MRRTASGSDQALERLNAGLLLPVHAKVSPPGTLVHAGSRSAGRGSTGAAPVALAVSLRTAPLDPATMDVFIISEPMLFSLGASWLPTLTGLGWQP